MKKDDVRVGSTYLKVHGSSMIMVRILEEKKIPPLSAAHRYGGHTLRRGRTEWVGLNVKTNKKITILSAKNLIQEVNQLEGGPPANPSQGIQPVNPVIEVDGSQRWRNAEGKLHREDGPAIIDKDETEDAWYSHGKMIDPPVVLLPTVKDTKSLNEAIEAKNEAGYRCFMLLRHLNRLLPLEAWAKEAVRRGQIEQDDYDNFFGTGDDVGSPEAFGETIESVLTRWEDANDKILRLISGK